MSQLDTSSCNCIISQCIWLRMVFCCEMRICVWSWYAVASCRTAERNISCAVMYCSDGKLQCIYKEAWCINALRSLHITSCGFRYTRVAIIAKWCVRNLVTSSGGVHNMILLIKLWLLYIKIQILKVVWLLHHYPYNSLASYLCTIRVDDIIILHH